MDSTSHLEWMLSETPERYHAEVTESHERLGRAAMALVEATMEYQAAIIERIKLNERIRREAV